MSILRVLLWPFRKRAAPEPTQIPSQQTPSLTLEQYESLAPTSKLTHEGKSVTYHTPNRFAHWRVQTLFTKEPDTIAWIAGFSADDVLLDIGANVGMYTIWAAVTRGVRVYAFEPESQNFALLNRNIFANKLRDQVTAFCAALSDTEGFSTLYLPAFAAAGSGHSFAENVDHHLKPRKAVHRQGCYAAAIDQLVEKGVMPAPTHIKIDVDGFEHKVIAGARRTLKGPSVRSILVEINSLLPEHRAIVDELAALGFTYSPEQVMAARRTEGASAGVGNYVFRR
jgi:FkbM family methyltransferase